jgi:hypothetical protein
VCSGDGWVLLLPSPKLQVHAVICPVEVSVNATFRGVDPIVGVPVKLATGAGGGGASVSVVALTSGDDKALSLPEVSRALTAK